MIHVFILFMDSIKYGVLTTRHCIIYLWTALFCFIFGSLNLIKVDRLESDKIKMYIPAVVAFLGTIFCNLKTLQLSLRIF